MTYNFTLTDGSLLTNVEPLESNGLGAQSTPRAVLDIVVGPGTNGFVVADDVTTRFVTGFVFNIISGPFTGSYTVHANGSIYNSGTNRTTIYVTATLSPLYDVNSVVDGVNGTWTIINIDNATKVFFPGASITVTNDSFGAANITYTVTEVQFPTTDSVVLTVASIPVGAVGDGQITLASSQFAALPPASVISVGGGIYQLVWTFRGDYTGQFLPGSVFAIKNNDEYPYNQFTVDRDTYGISNVVTGVNGVWTIAGVNVASLFTSGMAFTVYNNTGLGATFTQVYTVLNAVDVGPDTEVTVNETVDGAATGDGILARPVTSYNGGVDVTQITTTQFSSATTPAPTINTFTVTAVITGLGGTWTISGNVASQFSVGSSIVVSGDTGLGVDSFYTVASATDVGPNTAVVINETIGGAAADGILILEPSFIVHPAPPLPFGFIQYSLLADTSLELIGRGTPAFNNLITWGQALQDNDIHILENFNDITPPVSPLQGQLWFNQGTGSLFLFTSTVYIVDAVDPGASTWTIDGQLDKDGNDISSIDLTTIFVSGLQFAVYNNIGLGGGVTIYQVDSSSNGGAGTDTDIIVSASPTVLPPFINLPVETSINITADDVANPDTTKPFGNLYTITEWHELAFSEDVFTMDVKASVRAATTVALPAFVYNPGVDGVGATITGGGALPAIDGVALVVDDRLLVKDETAGNAPFNGIYTVTQLNPFILTRATDADTGGVNGKVSAGMFTFVEEGTPLPGNEDQGWLLVTDGVIDLGTTGLTFARFAPPVLPLNEIAFGTGAGLTSEADFTWDPVTDTLMVGSAGDVGIITNGDGGIIEFNAGGVNLGPGAIFVTMTNDEGGDITLGEVVYVNGNNTVALADANDDPDATKTIGLVLDVAPVINAAVARIITHGRITGLAGLVAGDTYYLSETAGTITNIVPVTVGSWVIPIGIALNTTTLLVNIGTPIQN